MKSIKTKNEFEYISSKQKNKFNIGMKLKNLLKENSNVIIPKSYDNSYNKLKYKNQISYSYKKEEIEDKTNDKISINSKDENSNSNYLTGSNIPRFTSFNFQSKKKRGEIIKTNTIILLHIVSLIIILLNLARKLLILL